MESNPSPRDADEFQRQSGGPRVNDTDGAPTRKRGDRVIVCGQDADGKTYRTATISMVRDASGHFCACRCEMVADVVFERKCL